MNLEKNKHQIDTLTRRQKIARRLAPIALLTAGVAGAGYNTLSESSHGSHEPETSSSVIATGVSEFGGEASGWEHGAATRAIESAVTEGAESLLQENGTTSDEIETIVDELPTYDQANVALDLAGGDIYPDKNDQMHVTVEVESDKDGNISYDVTDASIVDLPNNKH